MMFDFWWCSLTTVRGGRCLWSISNAVEEFKVV